jgi:hypothetical protein
MYTALAKLEIVFQVLLHNTEDKLDDDMCHNLCILIEEAAETFGGMHEFCFASSEHCHANENVDQDRVSAREVQDQKSTFRRGGEKDHIHLGFQTTD